MRNVHRQPYWELHPEMIGPMIGPKLAAWVTVKQDSQETWTVGQHTAI